MPKMIQVRNVPDHLHRVLKSRAAAAGRSLSEYLLEELRRIADRPTLDDMRERLRRRQPAALPVSAARLVRAERDAR